MKYVVTLEGYCIFVDETLVLCTEHDMLLIQIADFATVNRVLF
jgi:hypothetical protein